MRLKDKTIIITGASSGIGAAAAKLFAREGAQLVLGARREERLHSIADEISAQGGSVRYLAGDVVNEDFAAALVECALEAFGKLDGAFNNAGIVGGQSALHETDTADWHNVIATNLTSGYFAAKHQVPAMQAAGGGSIVFTSSFVGHSIGLAGMGPYAASKAGLIGMTQVLAVENGAQNIRVNALLPGGTKTEMAGDDPAFHDAVAGFHALNRMAEPDEIANAALFLLSDEGSFATGSALTVDGGNSIHKG